MQPVLNMHFPIARDLYINRQASNDLPSLRVRTSFIAQSIRENKRIVYTKYGDGEVLCMTNAPGCNVDGDTYSAALGEDLRRSFVTLCDASKNRTERILIGRWHYQSEINYLAGCYYDACIARSIAPEDIPFVDYHLIHNDDHYMHKKDMYELVAAIATAQRRKVVFTNRKNRRMCDVFRTTSFIEIPQQSWYQQYSQYSGKLREWLMGNPGNIVILSAGMAAKPLIADMFDQFQSTSFLDFGSAFDMLCQGYRTRFWKHRYRDDYDYYKALLPSDWPTPTRVFLCKFLNASPSQILTSLREKIKP